MARVRKKSAAAESEVAPEAKPDFEIHVRTLEVSAFDKDTGAYSLDPKASAILCGARMPSTTVQVLAPLDHAAYCPECREGKKKLKPGARYAVVMFRKGDV